jgi:hypothetical protein
MSNSLVYLIQPNGDLMWLRHVGHDDGTFRWEGPNRVGTGWSAYEHVFAGGNGIIYAIEPIVEASVHATGGTTPASGGNLLWYRHVGREDGTFRWEGPKKVGTGWAGFEHVFSAGDGVIYVVEPSVEALVHAEGGTTPAHGGNLLWYRHLGYADGTFRWQGPQKVGTGWNGLRDVFASGDGVIYAVENFADAVVQAVGGTIKPHGGNLRWFRHLGAADGTPRWQGPRTVGAGWASLERVFPGGGDIIYGTEPVIEAAVHAVGGTTPAHGGDLRWYRHVGHEDGTFRWEGPKKVGTGWGGLKVAFSGGSSTPTNASQQRFCGVEDPASGGIHTTAFGAPGGRWSRGNLTYTVNSAGVLGLTAAAVNTTLAAAFAQWQTVAPFFRFTQVMGPADITIQFGGSALDSRFGNPSGVAGVGYYPEDGRLFFDSAETWTQPFLLSIALHEIGHVLGLAHSTVRSSTMYPYAPTMGIDAESIEAINGLYGWKSQTPLADRGSTDGPSMATAGVASLAGNAQQLYMAWRGVHGDDGVYWSRLSGNGWSPQASINGIGSAHGPALASGYTNAGNGQLVTGLFMAWDGVPGDDAIYFAENTNPAVNDWGSQGQIPGAGTSARPALAMFNGKMHAAWKGISGDSAIYWSRFENGSWLQQKSIPGRGTSNGPSLAVLRDRLYMFWKGIDGDSDAYYAWMDAQPNAIWQVAQKITYTEAEVEGNVAVAIGTSDQPVATVRDDAIVLAWKGVPSDTALYFSRLRYDKEWSGQTKLADVGSSSGPAVADLDGRLYMAWTGVPGDTGLYFTSLG